MTGTMKKVNVEPSRALLGEVVMHCGRCDVVVERLERKCPMCGSVLRKECPRCHYWCEIDRAYCLSCKSSFPLPVPARTTIKRWHEAEDPTGQ